MSTFLVKSTLITNRDASPKVLTDSFVSGGELRESEGYVQTNGAADGAGSFYIMCSVPSNARVSSVVLQADALATSCTLDIGVWWPTYIPTGAGLAASVASTGINTTLFASAVAASNATSSTDVINQSTSNSIANQELPIWKAAGLATDPMIDLDIVVYVHAAVAQQGYIGLKVRYQQ